MSRFKTLLVFVTVAAAVAGFVRSRLSQGRTTDPGGWRPVDPA